MRRCLMLLGLAIGSLCTVYAPGADATSNPNVIAAVMFNNLDAQPHVQIVGQTVTKSRGKTARSRVVARIQRPDSEEVSFAHIEQIRIRGTCYDRVPRGWERFSCRGSVPPASFYAWHEWVQVFSPHFHLRDHGSIYLLTWAGHATFDGLPAAVHGVWSVRRQSLLPLRYRQVTRDRSGQVFITTVTIDYHAHFTIRAPR